MIIPQIKFDKVVVEYKDREEVLFGAYIYCPPDNCIHINGSKYELAIWKEEYSTDAICCASKKELLEFYPWKIKIKTQIAWKNPKTKKDELADAIITGWFSIEDSK